jgi:hypothetical protein
MLCSDFPNFSASRVTVTVALLLKDHVIAWRLARQPADASELEDEPDEAHHELPIL